MAEPALRARGLKSLSERSILRAGGNGVMSVVRRIKLLLLSLTWLALLVAAPAASAVSLRYWGGPVAHSMNVHLVEWGSGVRSTYTDPNAGDPAFFRYLASQSGTTTDIGGVLAQYMDTTEANSQNKVSYLGLDAITPPASGSVSGCSLPTCVDDSVIQSELRDAINASTLPAPGGDGLQTMYVVLFPPGTDICQGGGCAYDATGGFCAYHGSFSLPSSTQVLYAAMVDNGPGSPNSGACGSSANDIDNQTDVVSHEVAETINDPLVAESTRNGPPLGWYDSRLGEIADICVGTTEQALNGSWTVQKIWSNLDRQCVAGEPAYSAPTASFLADTSAATGQPVSFDASASSDPAGNSASMLYSHTSYSIGSGLASYRWDWGDGNTSTPSSSATATHAYASAGNYEVSLTVTDNLGFTSTVTRQVAVTGPSQMPAASTGSASGIDSQGATLNGTVNPENQSVQYSFLYGTSPSALDQSTPLTSGPTGTAATPVTSTLSGLSPSTTYYYELEVVSGTQTYTGSVENFTTGAAPAAPAPPALPAPSQAPQPSTAAPTPAAPPSVATGSASGITSSGATVAGSVNPNGVATTYQVQFGPSTSYGYSSATESAGAGTASLPVRVSLSGLKPGTTYHYRFVASDTGATAVGGDGTFTTARALAPAPRFSFRVLGHPRLVPSLRSGVRVRFSCSRACLARFSVVALPASGVLRAGAFPLSVASGSGRLHAKGSGTAVLDFRREVRTRLRHAKILRLSITGVAGGSGTATGSPVLRNLSFHPPA